MKYILKCTCISSKIIFTLGLYCIFVLCILSLNFRNFVTLQHREVSTVKPLVSNFSAISDILLVNRTGVRETMKYVVNGTFLNCQEKPLSHDHNFSPSTNYTKKQLKFAYAWYVTQNDYLCSAVVALKHLKSLRAQNKVLKPYRVDFVLIYAKKDFMGYGDNTDKLLKLWQAEGNHTFQFVTKYYYYY
jgi:hypothetical protein